MSYPGKSYSIGSIIFGGVLIVLGLALIVIGTGIIGDARLFVLGGFAVVGGALRLTTALAADARHRRKHPVDPSDPRWHGGSGQVQLAGKACAQCGEKIIVAFEAFCCEACVLPVHRDCRKLHHVNAHALEPAWPVAPASAE